MSKSKRHHYIPQFLIKNFTDDDGLLYVYNKQEDRIIGKKQSPKSIFFENDRNTVTFAEKFDLDNLEQLYSALDGRLAIDVRNVLKNKTVSPEELVSIALLAIMLKWRTPSSDKEFNILKEDITKEDLSIDIRLKDSAESSSQEEISHILNSDIFKETKRILLSILPLLNEDKLLDIHNNSFIYTNELFPGLIGDNPIIERCNLNYRNIENFIFPLGRYETFIYNKRDSDKGLNAFFNIQKDLAIIHLSEKYVACKSKSQLEKIVQMYNIVKQENKVNSIIPNLFKFLDM